MIDSSRQQGGTGSAEHPAIQELRHFLSERGYEGASKLQFEKKELQDAVVYDHALPVRMTKIPLRFQWSFSDFGGSWTITCGVRKSKKRYDASDAREWRTMLDGLEREVGDNSVEGQVRFFIDRLDEIESVTHATAPDDLRAALMDARHRLARNFPLELHEMFEELSGRGYEETKRLGPDEKYFGDELRVMVGNGLSFEFVKDRSIWFVQAGVVADAPSYHPAEVWRAWQDGRTPKWHDLGLGFNGYVSDVAYFRRELSALEAAVSASPDAANELQDLANGPWDNEPSWRRSWRGGPSSVGEV